MEQEKTYQILRDKALADVQRFVLPYISTGKLNRQELADWLTAFNTWLMSAGKPVAEERDYRRQFAAWLMRMDNSTQTTAQNSKAIDLFSDLQEQNEAPASKTVPLPIIFPPEQPKGKFSSGDNKFDMYWLKNLRDEVRSMGV